MVNVISFICFLAAVIAAVLGIFGVGIAHLEFWVLGLIALGFLVERVAGVVVVKQP